MQKPYILALCQLSSKEEIKIGGRSVLTAIASAGNGWTLFVTCWHSYSERPEHSLFFDENRKALDITPRVIMPPVHDLDLAIVACNISVPAARMRINVNPVAKETELSHARNVIGGDQQETFKISTLTTSRSAFKAARDRDNHFFYVRGEGEHARVKKAGLQTFYDVLEMESWPGVSGSPLWDQYGRIRGMVCGGDTEGGRLEDNIPRLVFLPAKKIMDYVQKLQKHLKMGTLVLK